MSEPIIAVSSNSCKCINQTMTTRACPECHGLIYSMPVLVEEIERLTKENERLTNLISSSGGLKCPNCDDVGFTAFQVNETDWEQSQCEFCYTVDDSIFMRGQS